MGTLRRLLAPACIVAALAGCAGGPATIGTTPAGRDLDLARDYVVASCLIRTHPGTPVADEADAWAAGLVARGTLSADAYPALAALAGTMPPPVTSAGKPIPLQGCIALRDDPAMTAKIARIVGGAR